MAQLGGGQRILVKEEGLHGTAGWSMARKDFDERLVDEAEPFGEVGIGRRADHAVCHMEQPGTLSFDDAPPKVDGSGVDAEDQHTLLLPRQGDAGKRIPDKGGVALAGGEGLKPDRIHVCLRVGGPAAEIVVLAAELLADLVVGTRGRGMHRLLAGSVAESVVRLCACPVLVVRPRG